MHDSRRTFSRVAFLATLAVATAAVDGRAQLLPNDILVGTSAGIFRLPGGSGAAAALVSGFTTAPSVVAFEIDQASGDMLGTSVNGTSLELWRIRIDSATNVVASQTLIANLPVPSGSMPTYIHREASGSYLVLARGSSYSLYRVGLTSAGFAAQNVPVVGLPSGVTDMAQDAAGGIHFIIPGTSNVFTIPYAGGVAVNSGSVGFSAFSIEFNAAGQRAVGGLPFAVPGPNYNCAGSTATLGTVCSPIPYTPGVVDLSLDINGQMLACMNGGCSPFQVRSISATCGAPGAGTLVFSPPGGASVVKATRFIRSANYGFPCMTSAGGIPQIGGTPFGVRGTTYNVALSGALASSVALISLGVNDLMLAGGGPPVPFDGAPIGAPGCFLWHSTDTTLAVSVSGTGTATFGLAIPNDPSLIGAQLFFQWLLVDPALNPLGLGGTGALVMTII